MNSKQIPEPASIKADVSIELVARYFGGNSYTPDKTTRDRIYRCINAASELAVPRATYTLFPVSSIIAEKEVLLEKGVRLSIPGCFADPGAKLVAAVIGTLGEKLEQHCRILADKGEIYESTLFDAVGTAMLDMLSEKICLILEQAGNQYGLLKGPRFAPGIDGYPLEQQHLLFEMADNASVGVSLNSSAIMMPAKSISFFMILTQTSGKNETKNKCTLCRMRKCQYRLGTGAK